MHFGVEHRKRVGSNCEGNRFLFARSQHDSLESFQLHDRPRDRCNFLMNVQLWNFIAIARSGVAHFYADLCRSAGRNLCWLHAQVFKSERCVTQPIAEGIQRLPRAERIAAVGGRFVIIKIRQIADRVRKCNRQLSARIHVPKQHIRRCSAAFLPKVPTFKYRWNMLRDVIDG